MAAFRRPTPNVTHAEELDRRDHDERDE